MCAICGLPQYVRCNCVSQQPFCDQCADDTRCLQEMDSQCVIYHLGTDIPTKLTNMGLGNGVSAQTIFEKIDFLVGNQFNYPLIAVDSTSIDFTQSGNAGHTITADVNISTDVGNILEIVSNGLYVPNTNDGKVKVNSSTVARYLEDAVIGATDGCVSISIDTDDSGLLVFHPTLAIDCLSEQLCADSAFALCVGNSLCSSNNFIGCIGSSLCSSTAFQDCVTAFIGPVTPTADNGLHIDAPSSSVELGGTLIKDTTIDHGGSYQLNFINVPKINIGSNTALTSTTINATDSDPSIANLSSFSKNTLLNNTGDVFSSSISTRLEGTTFTGTLSGTHSHAAATQLFFGYSGDVVLESSKPTSVGGLYSTIVKYGAGNVSGNIISGSYFSGFAADTGNVSDMAAILVRGLQTAPPSLGSAYTGTVTNYYGIYIDNIAGSSLSSKVTNKYCIYQEAGAGINSFSTNIVITSDRRIKENIKTFTKGLAEIENIRIVEYNLIGDDLLRVGVIGQEVENVIPEAVQIQNRREFDDFRVVSYDTIYSTLVNAVKELSFQNKALVERVNALEAK